MMGETFQPIGPTERRCADCGGKYIEPRQRLCEPCRADVRGETLDLAGEARRVLAAAGFQ